MLTDASQVFETYWRLNGNFNRKLAKRCSHFNQSSLQYQAKVPTLSLRNTETGRVGGRKTTRGRNYVTATRVIETEIQYEIQSLYIN